MQYTVVPITRHTPLFVWMKNRYSFLPIFEKAFVPKITVYSMRIINTSEMEQRVFSFSLSLYPDEDMLMQKKSF